MDTLQSASIVDETMTLTYDDCTIVMSTRKVGVMEVEFTPDYDDEYLEFSYEMAFYGMLFNQSHEDALVTDYSCDDGEGVRGSMRLTALKALGGDLNSLYDSERFDSDTRSRGYGARPAKERRGYRPWQSNRQRNLLDRLFR